QAMMRAVSPPTHHPIPLPAPSTSRRADIPKADIPPRKRLLLTASTPRFEVGERSAAAARQDGDTHATRAIMRIHALEAGARVDTLEDI
ncbi:hypothetical protein Tco_0582460, partial [Tanacetum coccineum]